MHVAHEISYEPQALDITWKSCCLLHYSLCESQRHQSCFDPWNCVSLFNWCTCFQGNLLLYAWQVVTVTTMWLLPAASRPYCWHSVSTIYIQRTTYIIIVCVILCTGYKVSRKYIMYVRLQYQPALLWYITSWVLHVAQLVPSGC